jgi:hypothetical protein
MHKIVLYNKSFSRDVNRSKKMLNSMFENNVDNIPIYISCPNVDLELFKNTLGTDGYTLVADEEIYQLKSNLDGWRSQQIVKSNLHKLNITENYLCVDSDAFFINKFKVSDFMANDDTPYVVMNENKEVQQYEKLFFGRNYKENGYTDAVKKYRKVFGTEYSHVWDYGPPPYLWSCKVWKDFEENYLNQNNIDFEQFQIHMQNNFNIFMREAVTYGEYLLATRVMDMIPIGPFFKFYHWKEMYEYESKTGMYDIEKLKENYLGIVMQSNWS